MKSIPGRNSDNPAVPPALKLNLLPNRQPIKGNQLPLMRVTCANVRTYFKAVTIVRPHAVQSVCSGSVPAIISSKQRSQSVTLYSCRCLITRVSFNAFAFCCYSLYHTSFQNARKTAIRFGYTCYSCIWSRVMLEARCTAPGPNFERISSIARSSFSSFS